MAYHIIRRYDLSIHGKAYRPDKPDSEKTSLGKKALCEADLLSPSNFDNTFSTDSSSYRSLLRKEIKHGSEFAVGVAVRRLGD